VQKYWIVNKLLMMIQNDWQLLKEKVFDHLDYFMNHILKYIISWCCFLAIQTHLLHVHIYIIQVDLATINKKIYISYYIYIIYFMLYFAWICILKAKLSCWILTTSNVPNNVNLENKIKSDLVYRKLTHIKTSPYYLDHLWKYVLQWLNKLDLKMFKIENDDLLNIKDLILNDYVTCVHYYEHAMNSFWIK
jgi:hypothetical protein